MRPFYPDAASLYQACQSTFAAHVDKAQPYHTSTRPSHLCVRSANRLDYYNMSQYAKALGRVYESLHDMNPVTWVKLNKPLQAGNKKIYWLEITAPDPEKQYNSGPQMLVFAGTNAGLVFKHPAKDDEKFVYRFQTNTPEQILRIRQV